jgi:peptide/nickel transport system permease protein
MLVFVGRRVGNLLLTMLVVSITVFLVLELDPGNVAQKVLGPYSSQEQRDLWMEKHGYNEPLPVRYVRWVGQFVSAEHGDCVNDFAGCSTRFRVPVNDVLLPRLAATGLMALMVMAIMVPLSLLLGVLAGMKEGSPQDRVISVLGIATTSVPEFASGVFLIYIFVLLLGWLPGVSNMSQGFDAVQLILPVLCLVLYGFGYITRMTRASMVEVMTTQYIRTAVLKGVPYQQVILRHALRNALIAPFTVILLQINWLLSGVIVVEFLFAFKGFGSLLLEAALNKDIFVIEACAMVAVFVAVTTQTLADLGYMYLNPRIRFS